MCGSIFSQLTAAWETFFSLFSDSQQLGSGMKKELQRAIKPWGGWLCDSGLLAGLPSLNYWALPLPLWQSMRSNGGQPRVDVSLYVMQQELSAVAAIHVWISRKVWSPGLRGATAYLQDLIPGPKSAVFGGCTLLVHLMDNDGPLEREQTRKQIDTKALGTKNWSVL